MEFFPSQGQGAGMCTLTLAIGYRGPISGSGARGQNFQGFLEVSMGEVAQQSKEISWGSLQVRSFWDKVHNEVLKWGLWDCGVPRTVFLIGERTSSRKLCGSIFLNGTNISIGRCKCTLIDWQQASVYQFVGTFVTRCAEHSTYQSL